MPQNNRTPEVQDYRHDSATRRNNPPAGIASQGRLRETPKHEYTYNPHLPPVLRFDETGAADKLPELLEKAKNGLSDDEIKILADALKDRAPWLEWAGKQEAKSFAVDPVALHIHERLSAKAILRTAARQDVQRQLFADPQQAYHEAVQFYQHDVDWSNRLILGDSLTVMSSLAHREDLAGKVQMIYIDPPYGIKFASNFQPTVFQRDVKDKESDLTREPEQIKAYRDTWTLGVHSYLAYLRDRLIVAKELLTDSGSIFVQISDENVHRVRSLMDEVFGSEEFVREIVFTKTTGLGQALLNSINDYLLWYAKKRKTVKYRQVYFEKVAGTAGASRYKNDDDDYGRFYSTTDLRSQTGTERSRFPIMFQGNSYTVTGTRGWSTNEIGVERIIASGRVVVEGNTLRFKRYLDDYPALPTNNVWTDVGGIQSRSDPKIYVVQTTNKVIERCIHMTTDPGDLVLDPTCGSGTTAYVAEGWGRRWITIDTSRVAVSLARQRLVTGTFNYYKPEDESQGVAGGFINKTVPHIQLKDIAQNTALDPIFEKHEPILEGKLETLNRALESVKPEIRTTLLSKLAEKGRREGARAVTDADRRRWELPGSAWKEWEVPFDTDPD